jgi:chromosome segregation ATPase
MIHYLQCLKVLALAALTAFLIEAALLVHQSRSQLSAISAETQSLITSTNERLDGTFRNMNAILIQAGLVAARVEDLSRNMQTVAKAQGDYWRTVQAQTTDSLERLSMTAESLNNLVVNLDSQVNGKLLPQATGTLQDASLALQAARTSIETVTADSHAVLTDPAIKESLASIAETTAQTLEASKNLTATTAEIAEASKRLPLIADSIEKVAKTSSKYRAALIISQIASALVAAIW